MSHRLKKEAFRLVLTPRGGHYTVRDGFGALQKGMPLKVHPFERPGRPITIEAHFESEPRVAEGTPACPVCGTLVNLGAIEHSIRAKPLVRPTEGSPSFILSCTMSCFKEACPVYLKLEVTTTLEEYEAWIQKPDSRLDHSHFRDNRPITAEAQADESLTSPHPCHCPVCLNTLDLGAIIPLETILFSGKPLPRPDEAPQYRATAYTLCPHCRSRLTCYCFVPMEELIALRAGPESPGRPP